MNAGIGLSVGGVEPQGVQRLAQGARPAAARIRGNAGTSLHGADLQDAAVDRPCAAEDRIAAHAAGGELHDAPSRDVHREELAPIDRHGAWIPVPVLVAWVARVVLVHLVVQGERAAGAGGRQGAACRGVRAGLGRRIQHGGEGVVFEGGVAACHERAPREEVHPADEI